MPASARIIKVVAGERRSPVLQHRHEPPRRDVRRDMVLWQEGEPEAGTPDEVGNLAALLMGPGGAFITDSDLLMDRGVTASFWHGESATSKPADA